MSNWGGLPSQSPVPGPHLGGPLAGDKTRQGAAEDAGQGEGKNGGIGEEVGKKRFHRLFRIGPPHVEEENRRGRRVLTHDAVFASR